MTSASFLETVLASWPGCADPYGAGSPVDRLQQRTGSGGRLRDRFRSALVGGAVGNAMGWSNVRKRGEGKRRSPTRDRDAMMRSGHSSAIDPGPFPGYCARGVGSSQELGGRLLITPGPAGGRSRQGKRKGREHSSKVRWDAGMGARRDAGGGVDRGRREPCG